MTQVSTIERLNAGRAGRRLHLVKPSESTRVDVRRLPLGLIDYDHYRTRAAALRGQAKRDARALGLACLGLVTIATMFVTILVVAAALTYAPNGETVLIQTEAPRFE